MHGVAAGGDVMEGYMHLCQESYRVQVYRVTVRSVRTFNITPTCLVPWLHVLFGLCSLR